VARSVPDPSGRSSRLVGPAPGLRGARRIR
jgi:hypothetical protein